MCEIIGVISKTEKGLKSFIMESFTTTKKKNNDFKSIQKISYNYQGIQA